LRIEIKCREARNMSAGLSFFLLQVSLIAVVLVMHTYMGLHIVRRTIIFCDLALAQLAALGALAGIGLGIGYGSPGSYFVSLVAVLLGSLLLAFIRPKNRLIPQEAVIGIVYGLALVASLLLGDKLSGGGAYVTKTLTGSMLWVSWHLVAVTILVYGLLLIFHYRYRYRFIALTEDPYSVRRIWDFFFFATQGIITVLIVPIAGVLLAYSFLMIPSAIAAMFTRGWSRGVLLGWGVGFLASLSGLAASYFLDLPYGPTLVLSLGVFFIFAVIIRSMSAQEA
jgi:zinc/manganese transport system permease protein